MGIGFLLFGYFFFCDFVIGIPNTAVRFDVLPDFFGWVLLFVGCVFASRFSEKFRIAKYITLVMLLPSLFSVLHSLGLWNFFFADAFYQNVYPLTEVFLKLVFHYYLLFGLRDFAEECGDQKALVVRFKSNFFMTVFCFLWIIGARVVLMIAPHLQGYCMLVSAFCNMVYLLLNAFAIYKAFREITVE